MKQKTQAGLISLIFTIGLTGCSLFRNPGFATFKGGMSVEGPTAILNDPSIETFELRKLFDIVDNQALRSESKEIISWDDAFAFFERQIVKNTPQSEDQRRLRNGLQDRIMAASNQRCGEYKDFLKRFDSETNIILGWLTTALAGAGAIATPAHTVRALSGAAAIFSGWRAEVNEVYFNKLTIQVISSGIEAKRQEILVGIGKKQKDSLADYTLQAGVADAAKYHYNCSLISGLEYAAFAIARGEDPGVKQFTKLLNDLNDEQEKREKKAEEKKKAEEERRAAEKAKAEGEKVAPAQPQKKSAPPANP